MSDHDDTDSTATERLLLNFVVIVTWCAAVAAFLSVRLGSPVLP